MRLRDLAQAEPLCQLVHPGLPDHFPPLRSLDTLPNNLPQPVTSFIGREKEIGEVKALLSQTRLLTLLGTGGAGKSCLSVQAAADLLDQYPDGVWLAELAPLAEGALVAQEVARVLRIPEDHGLSVSQSLAQALNSKHLLLILDNCEHVLAACATLADLLLRHCPHVRMIASSRQALHVDGEQVYPVPSLSLPGGATATVESLAQSECARLFVDRAMLHQPGFHVTPANASAVAEICTAAYPRGLVAVPGMTLQLRRPSHQTPARRAAYLTVTVPTSGYADIGLYRQADDRWVCVRSRVLRRTRSTITLSARPSARHPHARYAVLAHRTEMRPKPALKPSHAHIRVPLVKMSPPMPDGR